MDSTGCAKVKVENTAGSIPEIDWTLHKDNRDRLVAALKAAGPVTPGSFVLLQGGVSTTRHDTDHEDLFRQESNFHWAFGVREPDWFGVIDVETGRSTLFCPRLPDSYAVWMGHIKKPAEWQAIYGVDEVRYVDELAAAVASGRGKEATAFVLYGMNTDSKNYTVPASFEGIDAYTVDKARLWPTLAECRVFKTAKEQALLRFINTVSSEAHLAVMQNMQPGRREFQSESLFQHWCYYNGGARHMSYTCICATGDNGSVLHYGHAGEPNAKVVKDGDMCLYDMGSEYHCYGSDITTSFPANGKFTPDQKMVYEAVLAAQLAVMDAAKPGVNWVDMHALAYRTLLTKLTEGGLLTGDVEEQMAANLGAVFMPHGLGHFLGIDTHDVGGYPAGVERPKAPGFSSLRTARDLAAGMFITVEPGCYFIDHLLDAALADPARARFINAEALARFRGFGGVRIEDNILITEGGCENFTHAPRTVEDIEAVMAGGMTQRAQLKKFH